MPISEWNNKSSFSLSLALKSVSENFKKNVLKFTKLETTWEHFRENSVTILRLPIHERSLSPHVLGFHLISLNNSKCRDIVNLLLNLFQDMVVNAIEMNLFSNCLQLV